MLVIPISERQVHGRSALLKEVTSLCLETLHPDELVALNVSPTYPIYRKEEVLQGALEEASRPNLLKM